MFPSFPYRPFSTRIVLRSATLWVAVRATIAWFAGIIILEWEAMLIVGFLVGTLSYGDTARRREPLFLANLGVPRTSIITLTFGTALLLELMLYTGYATWIAS